MNVFQGGYGGSIDRGRFFSFQFGRALIGRNEMGTLENRQLMAQNVFNNSQLL
jgi:hypothetical protein